MVDTNNNAGRGHGNRSTSSWRDKKRSRGSNTGSINQISRQRPVIQEVRVVLVMVMMVVVVEVVALCISNGSSSSGKFNSGEGKSSGGGVSNSGGGGDKT